MREKIVAMLRDAIEPILREYIQGIKAVHITIQLEKEGKDDRPANPQA